MICDTLSDAVEQIRTYLSDPMYEERYAPFRSKIDSVVEEMDALRELIDAQGIKEMLEHKGPENIQ